MSDFKNQNLKTTLTWWLGKKIPFIINDEYKIELLFLDRENNSAKIKITNLSSNTSTEDEVLLENNDGQ